MIKFTPSMTKSISLAAASLLMAVPSASQAHDYDQAMDSCINAFVTASLPKEQLVTVRKEEAASSIGIHARGYKIILSAKGAASGKHLARSTCIVDRTGTVITLNGKPLPPQLAAAR